MLPKYLNHAEITIYEWYNSEIHQLFGWWVEDTKKKYYVHADTNKIFTIFSTKY